MISKTTLFGTVLQRVALGFVVALGLLSILASGGSYGTYAPTAKQDGGTRGGRQVGMELLAPTSSK
ncbi:MAG: hypothetical protein E2O38_14090 [Proteobacteria bacterium]|nr:MAG: hypothetical protein E2O38_14090 [Pseudomonadota bacterium]